jgi:hypothetical protein
MTQINPVAFVCLCWFQFPIFFVRTINNLTPTLHRRPVKMKFPDVSTAAFGLLTAFSILSSFANSQVSQAECLSYTDRLYVSNRNLGVAEEDYNGVLDGSLRTNCLSADGEVQPCSFNVGPSDAGDSFWNECINNANGAMWTYQITPQCSRMDSDDDTTVDIHMSGVWVCASVNCTAEGVQNLILQPPYMEALTEAGYTCGSVVRTDDMAPAISDASFVPSLSKIAVAAVVAAAGILSI